MEKIPVHHCYYEHKMENISNWKISSKEKEKVRAFVKEYENGRITGRIGTNSKVLIERLLDYLKASLESVNKDNPAKKDIEDFFSDILKDKIKSFNKKSGRYNLKPYSLRTKQAIFSAFAKYLKWRFPNKPELKAILDIDIKAKKKDPPSMTLAEIDKLYNGCKNAEERYFIAVLFSSGARAEEFQNIRFSDIELPKGDESFAKIRLRSEFTKTEGRTNSLYYKHALEAVREYLEQRKQEGVKPEEPIFSQDYWRQKYWLMNLGKRVLGKHVTYHLFRHTCATWLADRLNRQQLCIFFGWKFSSPMPDVYIARKGISMKEIDTKFQATEMEELKSKLSKQGDEIKLLKDNEKTFAKLAKEYIEFVKDAKKQLGEKGK